MIRFRKDTPRYWFMSNYCFSVVLPGSTFGWL